MKTVLAPNAPWPKPVEAEPKAPRKRKPPARKVGDAKRVDAKFAEWMKKQGELL